MILNPLARTFSFLSLVLMFSSPALCYADIAVQGTVRDTSHNILPGVGVAAAPGKVRTITDEQGKFSLTIPGGKVDKLTFYKPGYNEEQVAVPPGGGEVDATLKPDQNDEGLVRYTTRISLSHSLSTLQELEPQMLKRKLTEDVYREVVQRHGEQLPQEVACRIYLPPDVPMVSGIFLISEHGVGGPMMEHHLLREFANRHRFALIGVLGDPIQRGIYPAATLDSLLSEIGAKLHHPELGAVPAFTFGHSNGTGFSASYAAMRPDRVIGWISYHSGGSWHLVFPGVEQVPGFVMHGLHDQYFVKGQAKAIENLRRERNAPVSVLVEGEGGHWPSDRSATFQIVLDFCESCLRIRVPEETHSSAPKLLPAKIPNGWLGQPYDVARGGWQKPMIAPFRDYSGDRTVANWLPDESFARVWQHFSAMGTVAAVQDSNRPPLSRTEQPKPQR